MMLITSYQPMETRSLKAHLWLDASTITAIKHSICLDLLGSEIAEITFRYNALILYVLRSTRVDF